MGATRACCLLTLCRSSCRTVPLVCVCVCVHEGKVTFGLAETMRNIYRTNRVDDVAVVGWRCCFYGDDHSPATLAAGSCPMGCSFC
uniref:Putative secreted peptide n=1 Tax=Anopheles braziliensis TaxID=58242 RepID=A0A2M3ZPS4_9DIPT